jgi:hypothetical protein
MSLNYTFFIIINRMDENTRGIGFKNIIDKTFGSVNLNR